MFNEYFTRKYRLQQEKNINETLLKEGNLKDFGMKKERINENKVRFILDHQDLLERNLNISDLAYGSAEAKELFEELMELTKDELGLQEGVHPMMVEAIPMPGKGLVVNVTHVENPDELDPRFSRFTKGMEHDREPFDSSAPFQMSEFGPDFRADAEDFKSPSDEEDGPGSFDLDLPEEEEFDGPGPGDSEDGPGGPDEDGPGPGDSSEEGLDFKGSDFGGPDIKGKGPDDGFMDIDADDDLDNEDGPVPDGVQIQQGPEIRAQINRPQSSSIDSKDLMDMVDNIMAGLAGKLGASLVKNVKQQKGPENGDAGSEKPKKPVGEPPMDPFALYDFKDLQSVIHASKVLNRHYDSENILYKNPVTRRYFLYVGREHNTTQEFAAVIHVLNEFGTRCRISYATKEYLEEHTEKILEDALFHFAELDSD